MTGRVEVVSNDEDARRPLLSRISPGNSNDIDLDMAANNTRPGHEKWRRVVGLLLLFTTVVLWTASNFMASVRLPCPPLHLTLSHNKTDNDA